MKIERKDQAKRIALCFFGLNDLSTRLHKRHKLERKQCKTLGEMFDNAI